MPRVIIRHEQHDVRASIDTFGRAHRSTHRKTHHEQEPPEV
jgi:hypothetical protein